MQALLRTHTVALRPRFASPVLSPFSRTFISSPPRSQQPAAPKLSDGEQLLKDKIEANLDGAKVEVQDVSGSFVLVLLAFLPLADLLRR